MSCPMWQAPLIVVATLGIATSVMIEAILSFLGLGLQPPASSWGLMISEEQKYIRTFPYYSIFPGLMIMITVCCVQCLWGRTPGCMGPKTENMQYS